MSYELTATWPRRISDGVFVNPDTNPEYLAWRAKGNTPAPATKPAPDVEVPADPVVALVDFLRARPDVLALVNQAIQSGGRAK